jgi:hypothetical protein
MQEERQLSMEDEKNLADIPELWFSSKNTTNDSKSRGMWITGSTPEKRKNMVDQIEKELADCNVEFFEISSDLHPKLGNFQEDEEYVGKQIANSVLVISELADDFDITEWSLIMKIAEGYNVMIKIPNLPLSLRCVNCIITSEKDITHYETLSKNNKLLGGGIQSKFVNQIQCKETKEEEGEGFQLEFSILNPELYLGYPLEILSLKKKIQSLQTKQEWQYKDWERLVCDWEKKDADFLSTISSEMANNILDLKRKIKLMDLQIEYSVEITKLKKKIFSLSTRVENIEFCSEL